MPERLPLQAPHEQRLTIREDHARAVWARYAEHNEQSFERLHARGGFGLLEAVSLLLGQRAYDGEACIDAIFDGLAALEGAADAAD